MKKALKVFGDILICILIVFSFLAFNSAGWYLQQYGDVGFDSVLYTLFSDNVGVEQGLIRSYLVSAIPITIVFSAITIFLVFFDAKNKLVLCIRKFRIRIFPFKKIIAKISAVILSLILIFVTAYNVRLLEFIDGKLNPSLFYDENYIDPENVKIEFPENKRNLVYIFMESMEPSFLSVEQGGILKKSAIPELYDLALNNINFSSSEGVGGAYTVSGATWTIAALLSQTSGINFNIPVEANSMGKYQEFLPGLTNINDILKDNNYYQAFMCGSNAYFGGRYQYFETHGIDKIYDYTTAPSDGIIEEGYHDGWWGISDYDLYNYAKQEISKMASNDKPFALFMLTVDTHYYDGNICKKCGNEYSERYENVLACSSKQLDEFLNWAKTQDFYKDTTFVVVGDHLTMCHDYMSRNMIPGYTRQIYNCYVNSAISTEFSKNREFSQLDLFPTTLASLGCKIEGGALSICPKTALPLL